MNPLKRFFQEDIPATFSAGKWRIDLMQLKTRLTQLEKQRNSLLGELGAKAWNNKVRNESYGTIYGKLEEIDRLAGQVQQEIDDLQNNINLETNHLNTTNAEFETRIKGTQNQRQSALQKLSQLQTVQKEIEQLISKSQTIITQGAANLQNLNNQKQQIQASEQVDKEAKISSLTNTETSVHTQINTAEIQLKSAQADLENNQVEQKPIKSEVDGYNQLLTMLQDQNKSTLSPIQEQLKQLNQKLLKANEKKTNVLNQITAMMTEFGGQVYKYHPLSEILTTEYNKVDAIQNEIKAIGDQINLTQARLSSINSGSIRKVAFTGVLLIFSIFVVVILAVWVIPTAVKLLTPDPKSSIKLVQSWTLENCTTGGPSNGVYYDISVWENRRNDAIANVEGEARLLGTNDVVLASDYIEMEIAPEGMAVSMVGLDSGGSRVQEIKRIINSTYFVETSFTEINGIDVKPFFEKARGSNNITLGLEITNKSDFGIIGSNTAFALVINKQNKVIDILVGNIEDGTIEIDSLSKVTFDSTNYYTSSTCFQGDYTQEEVTFWYFVPLQISTGSENQFSVSGKAVYTP